MGCRQPGDASLARCRVPDREFASVRFHTLMAATHDAYTWTAPAIRRSRIADTRNANGS